MKSTKKLLIYNEFFLQFLNLKFKLQNDLFVQYVMNQIKQNIYIRKTNGFGQKISVCPDLQIKQLTQSVRTIFDLKNTNFDLLYKGNKISHPNQRISDIGIPVDGIIHLIIPLEQNTQEILLKLRIIYNELQYSFEVSKIFTVLEFKKLVAIHLNLVYQSLILSHNGIEMVNQSTLKNYSLTSGTLISLQFDSKRSQKKKLQSRLVSSMTFSDQNNQPIDQSDSKQNNPGSAKNLQCKNSGINHKNVSILEKNLYKSQISHNVYGTSKAAMMFTNALHQKVLQTQSVVSGEFSQQNNGQQNDPNCLVIKIKDEQDKKQFFLQCNKSHTMQNVRQKLQKLFRILQNQELQLMMQQDLFQSIDITKNANVLISQIVKKMGKQKTVFVYRIVNRDSNQNKE